MEIYCDFILCLVFLFLIQEQNVYALIGILFLLCMLTCLAYELKLKILIVHFVGSYLVIKLSIHIYNRVGYRR